MATLTKIRNSIKRKGLRNSLASAYQRYVYQHRELLWMERDLVTPVPPHNLKPYPPVQVMPITVHNVQAFTRYFGHYIEAMRELIAEAYTGLMCVDEEGDTVGFIWGSTRHYHDKHYYGCWFPVQPGEFFEFGGELTRRYWGTELSVDMQLALWKAMAAQGCNKVVDVCEEGNIPALKLHIRMDYREQGRITHVHCLFGRWKFFRDTHYTGSRLEPLRKPAAPSAAVTVS